MLVKSNLAQKKQVLQVRVDEVVAQLVKGVGKESDIKISPNFKQYNNNIKASKMLQA